MSVVIQQMIAADSSGIIFTADPISGNRNIISIDAGFGLGDALVRGTVSPDIYKYNKRLHKIVSQHIAVKMNAVVCDHHGGIMDTDLDANQSTMHVLSDEHIHKLVSYALKLENYYGAPQDIEWCIDSGEIYILQTRSITSLFPLPSKSPSLEDPHLNVFISLNHIQMMTAPISPLGQDSLKLFFRTSNTSIENYDPPFLSSAGGRLYIDVTSFLSTKLGRKFFPSMTSNMDINLGHSLEYLIKTQGHRIKGNIKSKPFLKIASPVISKGLKNFFFEDTSTMVEQANLLIEQKIAELEQLYLLKCSHKEKLEYIFNNNNSFLDYAFTQLIPKIIPGIIAMKKLAKLEKKLLDSQTYTNEISKGLEGNVTTLLGLWMGDLADMARSKPILINLLTNPNYATLFDRVNKLNDNYKDFKDSFNNFITKYGARAAGEIDIATKRWADDPETVAKSIMDLVETSKNGDHRKNFDIVVRHAKAMEKAFIEVVRMKYGDRKANKIAKLTKKFRDCMPLREHHKFLMIHYLKYSRRIYMQIAQDLVNSGRLDDPEDIFYIGFLELYNLVDTTQPFQNLVNRRKEKYQHFEKLKPPVLMTSEGEIITAKNLNNNLPPNALPGMAVSSGIIEGIAHVVLDPVGAKIQPGEILIAPYTDPGWTTLFINASGLVMEIGGLLTHGTVVAREYGIPAVVGIHDATTLIKTGQLIRVNANEGYVEILD
ncbi:hypothetical protein AN643_03315 [Candidatus Epulonipiscioides saccharophilum]|nr:hypothetical protein AN643_03315 [Epulopiscium sp. SCG-B10WGA-EpuloB]